MKLEKISPDRPDVKRLIDKADALMVSQYPAESNHLDGIEELLKENVYFTGAFINEKLVGIGAVKLLNDDGKYGEIKRVYVDTAFRGRKVAIKIMAELERHLSENQVLVARLETGSKEHQAINLYKKLAYFERGPYASYQQDPLSLFMEKNLTL